jgi:formylglycine-generating enzyme required for sulfatase activity
VGFGPEQFALILAGTFQMGSTNGNSDERPVHTVNITKAFYMQKTEVTQGQWRAVMGTNPSWFSDCGDTCPVEQVSWNDIQGFLTALNAMDPGKNYRLPTEAEWEYAARAGTTGDYGGTGVLDQMGWYSDNSGSQTHPVAQKQPNHWGLYDMHGNVWEWVQDWYSATYYSVSPTNDPQGPATGTSRVLRGGSWPR